MNKGTWGAVLVFVGLLLTLGGVGGVENSLDDSTLLSATIVSLVGLVLMGLGTCYINENTNRYLDYNTRR